MKKIMDLWDAKSICYSMKKASIEQVMILSRFPLKGYSTNDCFSMTFIVQS